MAAAKKLVVVGGGPGGYAAAFLAADLGLDVALVDDRPNPGGVCLFRGCIPSKALLHVAELIHETREAAAWGLDFGNPKLDVDRLRGWKDEVVEGLTGGLGQLARQRKVEFVRGRAQLLSGDSMQVTSHEGSGETWTFEHAVLATGSSPTRIPTFPEEPRVWDSTTALEMPFVPKRLLVVGGGYIGLELGTVYAALGSAVTVVEMLPRLLTGADPDLVRPLARRLGERFESIRLDTKVVSVEPQKRALKVGLQPSGGELETLPFDAVLVAVGRRPNTRGIGLENTRIELDDQGFVRVDAQLRTAEPRIRAIGDLVGQPMLAHKASHEGRVAAESIAGHRVAFEPACIPAVVFTDPEIAWCGLTEDEANASGRKVDIARFPWGASGRAKTLGRSDGLTKLIVDPSTRRVLGVGLCGPGAGEMIAEGALAIEMAALVDDLKLTIHPHPTLSETIMEAAESFFGHATHIHRPRRG